MIKIIMDSGKEYECTRSAQDIKGECYRTETITHPMGSSFDVTKFDAKFLKISDNIIIRTDHISSIEEIEQKTIDNRVQTKKTFDLDNLI